MHSFNIETPPSGQVVYLWVQTPFQYVNDPGGERMYDVIKGKWLDGIGYVYENGVSLEGRVTVLKWMDMDVFDRMMENEREDKEKEKELFEKSCLRKMTFPAEFKDALKACLNGVSLGKTPEIRSAVGSLCDAITNMIEML